MNVDPDIAKWEAQKRAARKIALTRFALWAFAVVVIGGIFGGLKWKELRDRAAWDAKWHADQLIAVPPEQIARAKGILQQAIDASAAYDAKRAAALKEAYATLEPREELGPCRLSEAKLPRTGVIPRTGFTHFTHGPDKVDWQSHGTGTLSGELRMIDYEVSHKAGSGIELGERIVREATEHAKPKPNQADFQFVIEEEVSPQLVGGGFTPGHMRGLLMVYDPETNSVPCATVLSGESSESVSVVTKSANPVFGPENAEVKIGGDLMHNTFRDAGQKLRNVGPRPSPAAQTSAKPRALPGAVHR